jgi:hypothetical protein
VRRLLPLVFASVVVFSSCKELHGPIDAPVYTNPRLTILSPIDSTIDLYALPPDSKLSSDNLLVTIPISARVSDSLGIASVVGSISTPIWPNEPPSVIQNSHFSLRDDGQGNDDLAGDGIFKGSITIERLRYEVGDYRLSVQATNTVGISTSPSIALIHFKNSGNRPPIFEFVRTEADTLVVPDSGLVVTVLTAKVNDPDNFNDVKEVTEQARKPDGSSAILIHLMDDGLAASADAVKGDRIYSTGIKLENSPGLQRGQYMFIFTATDKSGAVATDSLPIFVK